MGNHRKPFGTIILVVVNVLVFLLLSLGGRTEDAYYMYEHGAMFVPSVVENQEYFRLFSCIFLHFGFEHLMNNMVTLAIVGSRLEQVVGTFRFAVIYLLSGLGGNLLSLAVELKTEQYAVSAGASGAIFGLTGALLCLTIKNHGQVAGITKQGMLLMIGISLYNGFVSEGVDNLAHIGGLVVGFLVTHLLCRKFYAKCSTTIDSGLD